MNERSVTGVRAAPGPRHIQAAPTSPAPVPHFGPHAAAARPPAAARARGQGAVTARRRGRRCHQPRCHPVPEATRARSATRVHGHPSGPLPPLPAPRRPPPRPPLPHTTVPASGGPGPRRLGPASRDSPAAGAAPASPAMSRTPPQMEVHHGREKAGGSASQQTKGAAMLEPGGTDLAGFPAATSVAGAALVRGARRSVCACAWPAKSSLVHFWNCTHFNPWFPAPSKSAAALAVHQTLSC